jgi:predicted dehydrogenase
MRDVRRQMLGHEVDESAHAWQRLPPRGPDYAEGAGIAHIAIEHSHQRALGQLATHREHGHGDNAYSGVQIDLTGTEGDIRITNNSAFGDVGDDYVVTGAHGDRLELARLPVPARYDRLPQSGLPSAVKELAENYVAFARDRTEGTKLAPKFQDAVRMHRLIDAALESAKTGARAKLTKPIA